MKNINEQNEVTDIKLSKIRMALREEIFNIDLILDDNNIGDENIVNKLVLLKKMKELKLNKILEMGKDETYVKMIDLPNTSKLNKDIIDYLNKIAGMVSEQHEMLICYKWAGYLNTFQDSDHYIAILYKEILKKEDVLEYLIKKYNGLYYIIHDKDFHTENYFLTEEEYNKKYEEDVYLNKTSEETEEILEGGWYISGLKIEIDFIANILEDEENIFENWIFEKILYKNI